VFDPSIKPSVNSLALCKEVEIVKVCLVLLKILHLILICSTLRFDIKCCHIAGAKVYMACRSLDRGTRAADDIKARNKIDDRNLIVMRLDLNSLSSVRSFAEEFKKSKFVSLFYVESGCFGLYVVTLAAS